MLKPKFKMYQEVILIGEPFKDDLFGEPATVRKGQEGVIVLVNIAADVPYVGYVVEFFDKRGETVAISDVKEEDIAPLPGGYPDVKAVKPRKNKLKKHAA